MEDGSRGEGERKLNDEEEEVNEEGKEEEKEED